MEEGKWNTTNKSPTRSAPIVEPLSTLTHSSIIPGEMFPKDDILEEEREWETNYSNVFLFRWLARTHHSKFAYHFNLR
jgi:hypothetical protein